MSRGRHTAECEPRAELLEWVANRCRALADRPELRSERDVLADLAAHAVEPLRVVVTGDVSTGKSTLVNALLGQRLARVQREETTTEVTWYRSPNLDAPPPLGPMHSSRPVAFPLSDRLVLIDTPGVNTVSGNQAATEQLINGTGQAEATAGSATVLMYLCGSDLSSGALRRLRAFAALTQGPLGDAGNIVLVGAKADETVGDHLDERRRLERELAAKAGRHGGRSVAVAQLLAVTARTGGVDDWLVGHIRTIWRWPDLRGLGDAGWGVLELTARGLAERHPAEAEQLRALADSRSELGARCGTTYALIRAARVLDDHPADPKAAIVSEFETRSGLAALEAVLTDMVRDADVLTAMAVMSRLRRFGSALGPARGQPVLALLAEVRRHPGVDHLERLSAALMLEGDALRFVSEPTRRAAAQLLRGAADSITDDDRRAWAGYAVNTTRTTLSRRVAELVLAACADCGRQPSTIYESGAGQ